MNITPHKNEAVAGIDNQIPAIFQFITFRAEGFGAIVFNPYLGGEAELDREQAYIITLFNGKRTGRQILRLGEKRLGWTVAESEERLKAVYGKLNSIHALGFGVNQARVKRMENLAQIDELTDLRLSAPKNVTWEVTSACNLRCPHCFTSAGKKSKKELDTAQALALIDRLAAMRVFTVLVSGGEPFLRPDIMVLLKHISASGMRIDIGTNGTAIPDGVVDRLWDVRVSHVHVSIDGIGARHDRFRGKRGAFEAACDTIRHLRKRYIEVSISMAVTADNIDDLDAVIDLAVDLKCKGFRAIPFIPVGRGGGSSSRLALSPDDYCVIFGRLMERKKELDGKLVIDTEPCFPFITEGQSVDKRLKDGPMGCSAGADTLCIGADGTIYPCPYFRDFPLGNALDDDMSELWKKAPFLQELRSLRKAVMLEPCRSCAYAPEPCRGRCRAAAYLAYGDLRAVDPTCIRTFAGRSD